MSREVLAPPLQSIGAHRNYRVNVVHEYFGGPILPPSPPSRESSPSLESPPPRESLPPREALPSQESSPSLESLPPLVSPSPRESSPSRESPPMPLMQQMALMPLMPPIEDNNHTNGYTEPDLYAEDDYDDDLDEDCKLEELPSGLFKLTMHVAQSLHGGVIGFKGATIRRIENETQTEIFIPRTQIGSKTRDEVKITGHKRSNLCTAYRHIKLLTESLRKRMRVTHFVGVALNRGKIRENFLLFKKLVLDAEIPGIEEALFVPDARLHLTITVCILLDDTERKEAIEQLQNSKEYIYDLETPFQVKVSGLEIMNDDPTAVRIIYGVVDCPDLQKFANRLSGVLIESGLARDEYGEHRVKLHMTVLNVKHLNKVNSKAPLSFDAREVLKRFGDFNFGTIECSEVELCIRGAYIENGEARGYYKNSSACKLIRFENP